MDFIWWLEDLAKTNKWTYTQTYYNFAKALRNPAQKWLLYMVNMDNDKPDQHLWSDFKDIFKKEYTVQTNERLILEGLSNLVMKPTETTNEIISRITDTVRVVRESYTNYRGKIAHPQNDINGGISNHTFTTFIRRHEAMIVLEQYFKRHPTTKFNKTPSAKYILL
jgi:hypothetical protein